MASYASAHFVLGMIDRLAGLADAPYDIVRRKLEEERLPKRIRAPQSNKVGTNGSQQVYVMFPLIWMKKA